MFMFLLMFIATCLCLSVSTVSSVSVLPLKLVQLPPQATSSIRQRRQISTNNLGHKASMRLKDYADFMYTVEVSIGSPPQTYSVIPDTGSSDVWVLDKTCGKTAGCSIFCHKDRYFCHFENAVYECCLHCRHLANRNLNACGSHQVFDSTKSKTYQRDGTMVDLEYGTGYCIGFLGRDIITVGNVAVASTPFVQGTMVSPFFWNKPLDGVMGLGWPALSAGGGTTIMSNMIMQRALEQNVIGVYLGRMTENSGGEISFGGVNSDRFRGDITWVPISKNGVWQFKFQNVKVGSKVLHAEHTRTYTALLDTGTSHIMGPSDGVREIMKQLGASFDTTNHRYYVDCSRRDLPPIVFTIQGKEYPVTQDDYITQLPVEKPVEAKRCFVDVSVEDEWILGNTFIRAYYSVFDFEKARIGLAPAIHQSSGFALQSTKSRKLMPKDMPANKTALYQSKTVPSETNSDSGFPYWVVFVAVFVCDLIFIVILRACWKKMEKSTYIRQVKCTQV